MRRKRTFRQGWRLLPLCLLLAGCANDVTDTLIEQPLGKLSEWAVNLQFRMERDPLVHGFCNRVGTDHLRFVGRKNVPYRFRVVELQEPNAFAIPWGGIYVTEGLLRFADTEDEVSFVMGHEIGHVERRHSSLAFQRNLIVTVALTLLTTRKNQDWMEFAYIGNALLDLHFSRENEYAADRCGALYSFDSGCDPDAGVEFFRKLDERFGRTPRFWSYLQTHPINRDRITHLRQTPQFNQDGPTLGTIGDGYRVRAMYRSADRFYARAVSADANFAPGYLGLARTAAWRGDLATARRRYQEALAHGADPQIVQAELSALATAPTVPVTVPPPSSADVIIVTKALTAQEQRLAQVAEVGRPMWQEPLSTSAGLVSAHVATGTALDRLYGLKDSLPQPFQQAVLGGQRARGMAMLGASEVSEAGEQARLAIAQMNRNRERLLARLKAQPSPELLTLSRQVLDEQDRAGREARSGVQRLNETVPEMRRAVQLNHQAIARVQQVVDSGNRSAATAQELTDNLDSARHQVDQAMEHCQPGLQEIYDARTRALESSIDISMLQRNANERSAATQIIARLMLAKREDVELALGAGCSFGEAAYVLGMARSADRPPTQVLGELRDAGPRQAVERLGHRRLGRTENVAILLKLVDEALRREIDD